MCVGVTPCGCMQGAGHDIVCGDVGAAWEKCMHVVEGSVRVGGQEHFYLEPQGTVILPSENDEYVVISSTQVRHHGRLRQQWVWVLCVEEDLLCLQSKGQVGPGKEATLLACPKC